MKRIVTLLLTLCILLSFAACGGEKEPVPSFFYLHTDENIRYGDAGALIAPVPYEGTQELPLEEILQLYLLGTGDENLRNPIPNDTSLICINRRDNLLILELSQEFASLDDIQISLAGACLAATCHSLAGYEAIQVRSGENVYDFNLKDFLFLDDSTGE